MLSKKFIVLVVIFECIQVNNILTHKYSHLFRGVGNTAQDKSGNPPLHEAVKKKDLKEVRSIIQADKSSVHAKNTEGVIALHWAASNGSCDIAEELIARGSLVDKKDKYGFTPILMAAHKNYKEMVKLLIRNGSVSNIPLVHGINVQPFIDKIIKEIK